MSFCTSCVLFRICCGVSGFVAGAARCTWSCHPHLHGSLKSGVSATLMSSLDGPRGSDDEISVNPPKGTFVPSVGPNL